MAEWKNEQFYENLGSEVPDRFGPEWVEKENLSIFERKCGPRSSMNAAHKELR